jgi:hypothetical protein
MQCVVIKKKLSYCLQKKAPPQEPTLPKNIKLHLKMRELLTIILSIQI